MLYVWLVILIGILGMLRFIVLLLRMDWRNNLDGEFPSDCGSWAKDTGCTRITLEKSECVRSKDIPEQNSLVFKSVTDWKDKVESCIDDLTGGKVMSTEQNDMIHVTVNSAFFGFLDDMYLI